MMMCVVMCYLRRKTESDQRFVSRKTNQNFYWFPMCRRSVAWLLVKRGSFVKGREIQAMHAVVIDGCVFSSRDVMIALALWPLNYVPLNKSMWENSENVASIFHTTVWQQPAEDLFFLNGIRMCTNVSKLSSLFMTLWSRYCKNCFTKKKKNEEIKKKQRQF